ncbi:MAG: hypothetical protein KGH54_03740 [Candidatus Micrarchaeota archaeon]|nr:hypothetical protein [Candidatus Micrarchaeota archaeon]
MPQEYKFQAVCTSAEVLRSALRELPKIEGITGIKRAVSLKPVLEGLIRDDSDVFQKVMKFNKEHPSIRLTILVP